jgi:ADP-glucose pyrophosphorylase
MTVHTGRPTRIVAFVLAGGEGRRLRPPTVDRAKPAVRLAGDYRIIDFALANLVNSLVAPIYVLAQYKPDTLLAHLRSVWYRIGRCGRGCRRWQEATAAPPTRCIATWNSWSATGPKR